jgi:hypothetical protein
MVIKGGMEEGTTMRVDDIERQPSTGGAWR